MELNLEMAMAMTEHELDGHHTKQLLNVVKEFQASETNFNLYIGAEDEKDDAVFDAINRVKNVLATRDHV